MIALSGKKAADSLVRSHRAIIPRSTSPTQARNDGQNVRAPLLTSCKPGRTGHNNTGEGEEPSRPSPRHSCWAGALPGAALWGLLPPGGASGALWRLVGIARSLCLRAQGAACQPACQLFGGLARCPQGAGSLIFPGFEGARGGAACQPAGGLRTCLRPPRSAHLCTAQRPDRSLGAGCAARAKAEGGCSGVAVPCAVAELPP